MKNKLIWIDTFRSDKGLRYEGHFFPDNNTFALVGPIVNSVGVLATALEGAADTKEDAEEQIKEAIKNGLLK
jgi:hypothetical protein